jgi:hypothetical protein
MLKRTVPIILGLTLALAPAASGKQYILKHPKREHCRAHYVKRVEKIKTRRHHWVVKVRRVVCVYHAPKRLALADPVRVVKFHAHLDPSFTRDPANPFKVTFAYSASATSEPSGTVAISAAAEPVALPEGVLQFYNDGVLACSKNVGGATAGGECPITYSKLGEHTVTTIYTSAEGKGAATSTETEKVEPFSTTVRGAVTYTKLATAVQVHPQGCEANCYEVGTLAVTGSVEGPYGLLTEGNPAPFSIGPCAGVSGFCVEAHTATPVYVEQKQKGPPLYEPYIAQVRVEKGLGGESWFPPGVFTNGEAFVRLLGAHCDPGFGCSWNGYAESEIHAPVKFPVEVVE